MIQCTIWNIISYYVYNHQLNISKYYVAFPFESQSYENWIWFIIIIINISTGLSFTYKSNLQNVNNLLFTFVLKISKYEEFSDQVLIFPTKYLLI